ncbi:MAG: ABC transporter ATP-binding protein [bacterium]
MSEETGGIGATVEGALLSGGGELSISLRQVVQEFPSPEGAGVVRVIDALDLELSGPGIYMLLGPSGCGKSTLLYMMGGVRPFDVPSPTSGSVLVGGRPCGDAHDDVVMVFQRYGNRPDMSVRDNVAFPFRFALWKKRVPRAEVDARVDEMLEAVGLADKANLRPSQLSGGQNQRVALARALVLRPRYLLMDEPFGALDAQTRDEMQRLLHTLHASHPCLVMFVTHDVTEALALGDRVVVLSTRPAQVAADLSITEPRPRSAAWHRSTEAQRLEEKILAVLHGQHGHGHLRVSV